MDGLCIPEPVSDTFLFNPAWPQHKAYHVQKDIAFASVLGENPNDVLHGGPEHGRHLLISTNIADSSQPLIFNNSRQQRMLGEVAGKDASQVEAYRIFQNPCPADLIPLWPRHVIHQVELLLFAVGATHILYTGITMLICLWQVGTSIQLQQLMCGYAAAGNISNSFRHPVNSIYDRSQ